MILEIAGRDVEITTGVRFIRELDKRFKLEVENKTQKIENSHGFPRWIN